MLVNLQFKPGQDGPKHTQMHKPRCELKGYKGCAGNQIAIIFREGDDDICRNLYSRTPVNTLIQATWFHNAHSTKIYMVQINCAMCTIMNPSLLAKPNSVDYTKISVTLAQQAALAIFGIKIASLR
ncbi:hypothetical protein VNO77_17544 [Canavalia gladiata]|uniref:Uncharacterized protein n=1 Tax=Canavalia gladiata TaxID=3824 RepID=A0AAN9LMT3_CANGL